MVRYFGNLSNIDDRVRNISWQTLNLTQTLTLTLILTLTQCQTMSQCHNVTMSNLISGLISRYVTNSTPQDVTQTNTQSYGLLWQRGDQATVLDFSPERATDQGATSAAMSYSRRRDAATTNVTAVSYTHLTLPTTPYV